MSSYWLTSCDHTRNENQEIFSRLLMCVNKCVNGVGMRSSLRCSKCLSVVATRMNGLRLAPNITLEHRNSLINWSSWMLYHKIRCSSQSYSSIYTWRITFWTSSVITNLLKQLRAKMSNNFGYSGVPVSRNAVKHFLLKLHDERYNAPGFLLIDPVSVQIFQSNFDPLGFGDFAPVSAFLSWPKVVLWSGFWW